MSIRITDISLSYISFICKMMQFKKRLWIYTCLSLLCLSIVCANQSSIFGDSPAAQPVQSESTITPLLSTKLQRSSDTITKTLTSSVFLNITKTSHPTSLEITKVISSESKKSDNESRHTETLKNSISDIPYSILTSEYTTSLVTTTFKTTSPSSSRNSFDSDMKQTQTVLDTLLLQSETAQSKSTASTSKASTLKSIRSFARPPNETRFSSIKSTPILSAATQQPKLILSSTSSVSSLNTISSTATAGPISVSPTKSVTISESPITLSRGIPSQTILTSHLKLDSISPTPASASESMNSMISNISTTITSENFTQVKSSFTPSLKASSTTLSSFKLTETTGGAAGSKTTTLTVMMDSTESTVSSTITNNLTVSHSMDLPGNVTFKSEEYISSAESSYSKTLYLTSAKELVSQTESIFKTSTSQTTKLLTPITVTESRTFLDSNMILTSSVIGPTTNTSSYSPSLSSFSGKLTSSHLSSISRSLASMDVISASQNASGSIPLFTSNVGLTIEMPTAKPMTSTITSVGTSTASSSDKMSRPLHTIGTSSVTTASESLSLNPITQTLSDSFSSTLTTSTSRMKPSITRVSSTVSNTSLSLLVPGSTVSLQPNIRSDILTNSTTSFPASMPTSTTESIEKSSIQVSETTGSVSAPQQSSSAALTLSMKPLSSSTPAVSSSLSVAMSTSTSSGIVPTSISNESYSSFTPNVTVLSSSASALFKTTLASLESTMPYLTPSTAETLLNSAILTSSTHVAPTSKVMSASSVVLTTSTSVIPASEVKSTHVTKTSEVTSISSAVLQTALPVTPISEAMTVSSAVLPTTIPVTSTSETMTVSSAVLPTTLPVTSTSEAMTDSSAVLPTTMPVTSTSEAMTLSSVVLPTSTPVTSTSEAMTVSSVVLPTTSPVTSTSEAMTVSSALFPTTSPVTSTSEAMTISSAVLPTTSPVTSTSEAMTDSSAVLPTSMPVPSTSEVTTVSSAVLPTSTPVPSTSEVMTVNSAVLPTSTPINVVNATNAGEEYWIETVFRILQSVDVLKEEFRTDIENRFATCYKEGFKRLEGKSESILKKKRRRRYTQVGDAAVHIQHITRTPNTTTVSVAYTVEKSGTLLEPKAAIDALTTLDTQELAIILRQVVDVTAEPYIKVATPVPSSGDDSIGKLWIIGAVAGPVLALILIVWLVLCIYLKCCRSTIPEKQEEGEPRLTSIKDTETQKVTQFPKAYDNQGYSELPEQSSRQGAKTGRSYEVNPESEPEFIEAYNNMKVTPLTHAENSKQEPSVTIQNGTTIKDKAVIEEETGYTPQKKKKNRKRNGSIEPLGPGSSDNSPRLKSNSEHSFLLQSSVSGEDEELKGRTENERKKNKERLREKQKKRKDDDVRAYLEAQREIDQVLGAPNGLPDVFVENSDSANHAKVSRQDSGVSNEPLSGEETLEEARMKMHQLLDDAFTLISPRESLQENDIRHGDKITTSSPERKKVDSSSDTKSKISTVHLDSTKDLGQHIKHEPMYFDPGYSHKSFPLETWSPYRASDQVALISMPNTMETKLGGPKAKNKEKERPTTSRSGRRPAASFDTQESKSTGHQEEKYASSSPQPIVLRSKDLASYVNVNKDKQPKESVKTRQNSLGKYAAMTSLNGDVYLSGSTTKLSKKNDKNLSRGASSDHKDRGIPHNSSSDKDLSIGEGIELRPLKRKGWATVQKHRGPVPHQKDSDEVDVINDIQPTETSDDLIKSLRDELQLLKGSYNLGSKSPKTGKKGSGMTEIV